jgi:hypothetical protein
VKLEVYEFITAVNPFSMVSGHVLQIERFTSEIVFTWYYKVMVKPVRGCGKASAEGVKCVAWFSDNMFCWEALVSS